MTLLELARKLRPYIEKAALSLSDEDALEAKELYPQWSGNGISYKVEDKVRYDGIFSFNVGYAKLNFSLKF